MFKQVCTIIIIIICSNQSDSNWGNFTISYFTLFKQQDVLNSVFVFINNASKLFNKN